MPSNTFIFPVSGIGFARSACLTTFATTVSGVSGLGYLAGATYESDPFEAEGIWTFNQTQLATAASTSGRYIDATTDGVSGFYILGSTGPLIHVPTINGAPTSTTLATSPSFGYTGLTFNTTDNKPYFIGYDGTIYKSTAGVISTVTGPPGGVTTPARQLYSDASNNLWTSFPASKLVAKYSIGGAAWTTTAAPFSVSLDTISYSSSVSALVAGGTNSTAIVDSNTIIDIVYATNPNQLLVADNGPGISVYVYNLTNGGWNISQSVAGYTGIPTAMAVEPDGNQVLVTDLTNNRIEILSYSGVWNETSTTSITGPTAIAIHTKGVTQALVCQPSQNQLSVLNKSVSTWSVVQTLSIPGPTSVTITDQGTSPTAVVTTSTGVTFLIFNGAVWVITASIVLNPVPTICTSDSFNDTNTLLYAAGSSGGNTTIYIFQNASLVGQYTVSDVLGGLAVIDWQIIVPTNTGVLNIGYYVGGVTSNTVTSIPSPTGTVNMAWVPAVSDFLPLLVMGGTHNIWTFYNNSPQSFIRTIDSSVAVLSAIGGGGGFTTKKSIQFAFQPLTSSSGGGGQVSGSWTTLDLLDRNKVSSIVTDPNKNIFAVTVDNDIYKFNISGALVTGYPYTLIPPTGQEESIPLGLSKLIYWNGFVVAASSLMGGLVLITP